MMKDYEALKLSQVIEQLQKAMKKYGDVKVMGKDEMGTFVAVGLNVEKEICKNEQYVVVELD